MIQKGLSWILCPAAAHGCVIVVAGGSGDMLILELAVALVVRHIDAIDDS